ncbi:MAG: DUF971 domain-containing protein [Gammaproteobacteria bacterium]|nr:DUF971 domain-containing protein [Gammaproteobacteria bacterium]
MNDKQPTPTQIKLRKKSKLLDVVFDNDEAFSMAFEYLRVFSPSAEVRGHGAGQTMLVIGKENVDVKAIEPVGRYAVRLVFDDGHDSGIYTWPVLLELGREYEKNWQDYLARLEKAGVTRSA